MSLSQEPPQMLSPGGFGLVKFFPQVDKTSSTHVAFCKHSLNVFVTQGFTADKKGPNLSCEAGYVD
jgi:hypothetical protein